jgi:hypothetical protein
MPQRQFSWRDSSAMRASKREMHAEKSRQRMSLTGMRFGVGFMWATGEAAVPVSGI